MIARTLNEAIARIEELESQRDEVLMTELGPWRYGLDLREQKELAKLKSFVYRTPEEWR